VTERRRDERQMAEALAKHERTAEPGGNTALAGLPKREMQLLESGLATTAISNVLGVSRTTVRNHVEHLLAKLGSHSRLEAVVRAARRGLI
jgi:DNA-binding NarL/FixJ family response regulator